MLGYRFSFRLFNTRTNPPLSRGSAHYSAWSDRETRCTDRQPGSAGWARCARCSGKPARRWAPPWQRSQSTGCRSWTGTTAGHVWRRWRAARGPPCFPAAQRGSSRAHAATPGSRTRLASCPAIWRCWERLRQRLQKIQVLRKNVNRQTIQIHKGFDLIGTFSC